MPKHDILEKLMVAYDKQFPTATPFERGSVKFDYEKTLDAIEAAGLQVVDMPPPQVF